MYPTRRSFLALALSAASLLPAFSAYAAEPKKVIVCTVTTGFRHSSIPVAEKTLQKLADESKAFTIVEWVRQPANRPVPPAPKKPQDLKPDADDQAKSEHAAALVKFETDTAVWKAQSEAIKNQNEASLAAEMSKLAPANLAKVDGVIFANTTGDNFPLPDKDGFFKWVQEGGAFMGMHSATDTFKAYQPYYEMLQGTFVTHGAQVPADLTIADTEHPSTKGLPPTWDLKQEEMYLIKNHDRAKLHSLVFLKHHPNHPAEKGYFPVSWCRKDGKGRVFYTILGHREDLWSDDPALGGRVNPVETAKQFQQHILGGIKWALGIDEGSAEVNNPLP